MYSYIKWYQCELRLEDKVACLALDTLAVELIELYKNKLGDEYDSVISDENSLYKNLAGSYDKEKYEIFKKIFLNHKIDFFNTN